MTPDQQSRALKLLHNLALETTDHRVWVEKHPFDAAVMRVQAAKLLREIGVNIPMPRATKYVDIPEPKPAKNIEEPE